MSVKDCQLFCADAYVRRNEKANPRGLAFVPLFRLSRNCCRCVTSTAARSSVFPWRADCANRFGSSRAPSSVGKVQVTDLQKLPVDVVRQQRRYAVDIRAKLGGNERRRDPGGPA